jgi:hypothetical protein
VGSPRQGIQSLFDDGIEGELPPDEAAVWEEFPWRWVAIVILISLLLVAGGVALGRGGRGVARSPQVELLGAKVGRLRPGAAVVLGGVRIGSVSDVQLDGVEPVAVLQLDESVARQLTSETRWFVRPLSAAGSNVGVEIVVDDRGGDPLPRRVWVSDEPMQQRIGEALTNGLIKPGLGDAVAGGRMLVAMAIAIATVVGLAWRSLRIIRGIVAIVLVAASVAVAVYLFVGPDRLSAQWGQWVEWIEGSLRELWGRFVG